MKVKKNLLVEEELVKRLKTYCSGLVKETWVVNRALKEWLDRNQKKA